MSESLSFTAFTPSATPAPRPSFLPLLFGVLLPVVTVGVELTTRMNSEAFFDPLPSLLHVFLVLFVPAANVAVWMSARNRTATHLRKLSFANSCAFGIAMYYTVLFVPLLPIGAVALVYFGFGLLPLTPLISLLATLRLRKHLSRLARANELRITVWPGLLCGFLALVSLELPATFTRISLQMATSDSVASQTRGVRWLRIAGDQELLLRLCYVRSGATTDMVSFLFNLGADRVPPETVRTVYYRVTGQQFNAVPAPVRFASRGRFFSGDERDDDQGQAAVGGRVVGLSLAASRLDGSVDANAALGYLEWTMVFKNKSSLQSEARAQIQLPRGAAVSRLTLWINGEEREAAFAGRGAVRQAYERIVQQRRDPVLVTTAGADRIAMQLFPVPPQGEMKVRVGMSFPLERNSNVNRNSSVLRLPVFHEHNFAIAPQLRHGVWIESKTPLRAPFAVTSQAGYAFTARAEVPDEQLSTAVITTEHDNTSAVWAADEKVPGYVVRQRTGEQAVSPPPRLTIVVDGSIAMRTVAARIAKILAQLPQTLPIDLVMASDAQGDVPTEFKSASLTPTMVASRIEGFNYVGGNDNTEALANALDGMPVKDSALLWIHGPQPVLLTTVEKLLQRVERGPPLTWYDVQVQPGVNLIGEKLDGVVNVDVLHEDELVRLIASWHGGVRKIVMQRERVKKADTGELASATQTSDHLVRLWANDEIHRLVYAPTRAPDNRQTAISLAHQYQLVTPVSGAVVLETQQQYDAAGLTPVAAGTVPTIPEPETWALIGIVLAVLAYAYRRRKATIGALHAT